MENILRNKLIGEQLGSIEFVMDYLQLHFDGKTFTIYIWPQIILEKNVLIHSDLNYKNELCAFIGYEVSNLIFIENQNLDLIFNNSISKIRINLNPSNPDIVSEIAIFNDKNDDSWFIFE